MSSGNHYERRAVVDAPERRSTGGLIQGDFGRNAAKKPSQVPVPAFEPGAIQSELTFSIGAPEQATDLVTFALAGDRVTLEVTDQDDRLRCSMTFSPAQIDALANWLKFVGAASR